MSIGPAAAQFVKINGETHYLWRAIDHEGEILECYVAKTRDRKTAFAFMKKALKRHSAPQKITTDGCRSYGAAMDQLGTDISWKSAATRTTG